MSTTTAVKSVAAVEYFRVSTTSQAGEHHVSLETQEASFRTYCTAKDLKLVATFTTPKLEPSSLFCLWYIRGANTNSKRY